jgi:hypothetical protein
MRWWSWKIAANCRVLCELQPTNDVEFNEQSQLEFESFLSVRVENTWNFGFVSECVMSFDRVV